MNSKTCRRVKKSVAFDDRDVIQLIDDDEDEDEYVDELIGDEVEEEYSYGGLLRPVSHKAVGTAKSFEHYLNTQDLTKNVQRLKSPSGDDRVRVRRHRKQRSRSPIEHIVPAVFIDSDERDSDYANYGSIQSGSVYFGTDKSTSPGLGNILLNFQIKNVSKINKCFCASSKLNQPKKCFVF